jgi:hypothetical protein
MATNMATKPDHSQLAMQAAKRMQKSRQKEKNGRIICLHLLEMLADEAEIVTTKTSNNANSRITSRENSATYSEATRYWIEPIEIELENGVEKQYSLLF